MCFLFALDPGKRLSQYTHKFWGKADGLPITTVNKVSQTPDGYLWLATASGLVRYDGAGFRVFDKSNTEEIKENHIETLFTDREGTLWCGTWGGGLIRVTGGKFKVYTTEDGLPGNDIWAIHQDRGGDLWFGTRHSGLCRLKNGTFTAYSVKDGLACNEILAVFAGRGGNTWVCTKGSGLCRFSGGTFTTYTGKDGLTGNILYCVYEDRKGRLWVGGDKGLNLLEGDRFSVFSLEPGGKEPRVSGIYEDRRGNLWIGAPHGIYRLTGRELTFYDWKDKINQLDARDFYEDSEGSLWVGVSGTGLLRLRDGKFTTYSSAEGLTGDFVKSVWEDHDGVIWISTNSGLNRFKDNRFSAYTEEDGLSGHRISAIWGDRRGNLWTGTFAYGVNLVKEGVFSAGSVQKMLPRESVNSIYEDREGITWFGTERGLHRYKDGEMTAYTIEDGLPSNDVRGIYQDRAGTLWIATLGGMAGFKKGKFSVYTTADGLSAERILSFYEDPGGSLWIGTYGGGLNRMKNGKITAYTTKEGLYDDSAYQVLEDGKGNLWMGSNHGIFRVNKKDIDAFDRGELASIPCVSYGEADGLKVGECNGGSQPSGWKGKDGRMWFATQGGVAVIDPENIELNTVPPPVVIEKVLADNQDAGPCRNIRFQPGKKDFEFHYTALSLAVPERIAYKYRLEGYSDKWVEAGGRRTAYFTGISPGKYRFRVIACNNDGLWNETGAFVDLHLEALFYQTSWFYGLCGLLAVFSGVSLYRLRIRRLKLREAELARVVAERTAQLRETNRQLETMVREKEKLSIVARETDNAIAIMDAQGNFEWKNEGFTRLHGMTMEQWIEERGGSIWESSSNPDIESVREKCLEEKQTVVYESLMTLNDGKKIWTQTTLTPILNPEGEITKLIAIDTDITLLKEAEKSAEKANQAKSEFLARMSHEIRTPMNGIIGFTEMLLETSLSEQQRDYARTINRSGEALIALLNDILDFSRIEAGELSFEPVDFDPEITAFDVCDIITPRISSKPVEIFCRIGENVPAYVKSDVGRFRQVLINLMGNAAKFTEKGEIELSLEIEEEDEASLKLHVKVRDSGIGIPPDQVEMIFDAFQQIDGSVTRNFEGTGLGLSICKQIAGLMGGEVWVESEVGKGSLFHFTSRVEKSVKSTGEEPCPELPAEKRVLILDDNDTNLDILTRVLERAGMRVTALSEGGNVLSLIRESFSGGDPFHIGILDIQMSGISGYDVAQQVRGLDTPMNRLPLLAFSSSTLFSSGEVKESGFDGFLPKPIRRKKMLKMLAYLLGKAGTDTAPGKPKAFLTQHSVAEVDKHSVRILLAEDNPVNQKLARFMLTKAGYQVKIVETGQEVVEVFTSKPENYDLIFMDIQMPGMDGKEATRRIRGGGFRDIPIVAMTAGSMKGDREKCLKAGMNDYISKPIKRERVFEMVRKWCLG